MFGCELGSTVIGAGQGVTVCWALAGFGRKPKKNRKAILPLNL
jgi:hypothetical protein